MNVFNFIFKRRKKKHHNGQYCRTCRTCGTYIFPNETICPECGQPADF